MIRWRLPVILICITLSVKLLFADQEGFSDIQLHDGSGGTEINLHMGEETEIYVHLNSHGELLTGFQLMLTLQAGVLEIIPGEDGLPFQQLGEGYFAPCGGAIVLTNNLHGDPDNGLPGTQLDYIIQTGQGESPRPSCANNTDILSFRVRALSEFSGWPLTIDQDNLIFRNTLYWQAGSNATWDFNLEQTPQFTIAGFAFFPPLPDLQLTTTAPRDTINLYDYLEAFFSPDSEFVIGYQVIAGAAAALVDTVRIDGQEFLFIFARQPVEPALMEVVITATALDTVNACDTMLVLCDDPPIVNEPLPNLLLVEDSSDSTLWLDEWISDNDHADSWLTYAVLEQSFVQLSIDPVTHRATVTPPQDWYGVDTLGFVVTDPLGQADSAAIAVEVLAVNDAPQLAAQLQFPLYPGSELVLSLSDLVYDPDNSWQELDWSLAGGQDSISTILDTVEGTLRCFTTALSLIDSSFSYLLSVSDLEPLTDQDTLWLQVQSAPPRLTEIPAQVLQNGAPLLLYLDDYVSDADHSDSELIWSTTGGQQSSVMIDPVTHVATLSAGPYAQGWEQLYFTVVDPDDNRATAVVTVVLLYNDLPEVAALPDFFLLPGEVDNSLDLDDHVWDSNHQPEEMTWDSTDPAPFQLQIDPVTHLLTIRAPFTPGIRRNISLYCFDPDSNLAGDDCQLLVIDTTGVPLLLAFPELTLPTLSSTGPWTLDNYVYDHDDPLNELQWSHTGGSLVETILDTVSRRVTFHSLLQTGIDSVYFTVNDPSGNSSSAWWPLQVTSGLPPQLTTLPVITLRAGECDTLVNLSSFAYDPDTPDEYLSWSVTASDSVEIVYQPQEDQLQICSDSLFFGTVVVEVTVTDNDNNSDSGLLLIVSQENIAPGINSGILPNPAINEYLDLLVISDESLREPPQGSVGESAIAFSLLQESVPPEGYSFYRGSWLFSDVGSLAIALLATDLVGNQTADTLYISSGYMQSAGDLLPGPHGDYELLLQEQITTPVRYIIHDLSANGQPGFELLPLHLPGAVRINFTEQQVPASNGSPGIYRVQTGDTTWCVTYQDTEQNLFADTELGGTYLLLNGDESPRQAPTQWRLSNPRPNPFNPSTVFTVSLCSGEHLQATVYDILGRRVALLWDGYLPAGNTDFYFAGTQGKLASGVYFLQVHSPHLQQTRKMMYLK